MSAEVPFTPVWPPLKHQAEFLSVHARRASYALFWEQGTGKTKALIDNAALLYVEGEINALFVLAPNGVHRNWHVEELPKHWPKDAGKMTSFSWDTTKAGNVSFKSSWEHFLGLPNDRLKVLCMSYDALMTEPGKKGSWDFLRQHDIMYVGDESQRFKTPNSARTKRVIASSPYSKYRRIASGTPMDGPFDIYSQVRFLDPEHWMRTEAVGTFTSFKARFANIIQVSTNDGKTFPKIESYRDLDRLEANIAEIGSRVTKEDVLDLPPKTYKRVYHELTNSQRAAYEELKRDAMTYLESGELVTADMALTLHGRLSQIGCGFIIPEAGADPVPFSPNPRAAMLKEIMTDLTRPSIIWGRYKFDCQIAYEVSKSLGRRPVIFNGERPELSIDMFHDGKYDDIIANIGSNMREGYTLNEADTTIYYSNAPWLLNRQQSEDRNHRIGQRNAVTYIDLLAERTLDTKTLKDLQNKREVTGTVLGDKSDQIKAWLMEALSE